MREEELCAEFKDVVEGLNWVVYPETAGWDLLLVGPEGLQVGVEAKLRGNVDVLAQAVGSDAWPGEGRKGPDYRAVLVPQASSAFDTIARLLHVVVFDAQDIHKPYFAMFLRGLSDYNHYMCWRPSRACWMPPVPINVPAGVPSPASISPWKVAAVQLCLRLRQRGFVTSRDFSEFKIAFSPAWRNNWLQAWGRISMPSAKGRAAMLMRYIPRPGAKLPDVLFPEIATALQTMKAAA